MSETGKVVRKVGHPTVAILAARGYRRIAESDDLSAGQRIGSVIGTAVLESLGHVAVEAIADWAENRRRS